MRHDFRVETALSKQDARNERALKAPEMLEFLDITIHATSSPLRIACPIARLALGEFETTVSFCRETIFDRVEVSNDDSLERRNKLWVTRSDAPFDAKSWSERELVREN